MDIPNTQVIRHWIAWGPSEDCPDDLIEHDPERVEMFQAWLTQVKADAWEEGWRAKWEGFNPYKRIEESCR